jgi:type VI secretion system protein ImpA
MNTLDPKLLEPVSAEQPSGPDLSYDPKMDELETILKGKPEVDIGSVQRPAEPPDWRELQEKSQAFLAESKHLRVATMLGCSLLKTQGLPGFRDSLGLIQEWLEKFWPTVYPVLDVEDNNDPTQRLNILGVLTAPRGSVSGWLTIVDNLYAAEFYRPKGSAPVTFDQLLQARSGGADAPDAAKLAAGIREADKLAAGHQQVLRECLETVRHIDQLLTTNLGSGGTISFEVLEKTLQELEGALAPFLPGAAPVAGTATGSGASEGIPTAGVSGESSGITISGSIRSRDDVVRVLDGICNYYKQVEPGSPVPYLLRRARKLARMDFIQAVHELNLATPETLRPSIGSVLDDDAPAAPAASTE